MKVKLTDLAKELDEPFPRMLDLVGQKLTQEEYTGTGKNTRLSPDAAEKLRLCFVIPPAVPDVFKARVLREMPNPKWVFCALTGIGKNVLVLVPKRLRGKLVGKNIEVHAINDANGTTYRHADCAQYVY